MATQQFLRLLLPSKKYPLFILNSIMDVTRSIVHGMHLYYMLTFYSIAHYTSVVALAKHFRNIRVALCWGYMYIEHILWSYSLINISLCNICSRFSGHTKKKNVLRAFYINQGSPKYARSWTCSIDFWQTRPIIQRNQTLFGIELHYTFRYYRSE